MLPLMLILALAPTDHEQANPLYKELRQGVAVGKGKLPLPPPSMADGLDAKGQLAVISSLAGQDFDVKELLRDSIVAPHIYKRRQLGSTDPRAGAQAVDVWFIAYGDLQTLGNKEFLEKSLTKAQKDRKVHILTDADLAKRKLERAPGLDERFSHAVFSLLDRVEISAVSRTVMSKTADSLLFATQLDPRFQGDADFPNQWRSMQPGNPQLGKPEVYAGSGGYMKVTRLAEPKGALFIEYHFVFAEPKGWFNGQDLLGPKLTAVVQSEARALRTELKKAAKE